MQIKFTYHSIHPFKVYNSVVFNIFSRLYSHCHNQILEHFITPERNLVSISSHSLFPLSSYPQIDFLFLGICLCCTFIMNEIIRYVALCEWFLSLIICSRSIYLYGTFSLPNNIPLHGYSTFHLAI